MANIAIRNLRFGELSPTFYGASNTAAYQAGLRRLLNGFVMRQGGVQNRPGTEYLGVEEGRAQPSGLIDFTRGLLGGR